MCDCLSEIHVSGQVVEIPCEAVTIDLLKTYKKPIDCIIKYQLYSAIDSNSDELILASTWLAHAIDQLSKNPGNCQGFEKLNIIRFLVDRIMQKGICL